jgi:L-threonylcarbamoyladenylate synthase
METLAVSGSDPDAGVLARALELLRDGSLVIYPTDTLYALGGRALDARAAAAVREAKGRALGQPLPLIAADVAQVREIVTSFPRAAELLAARFWPGPLSIVLAAASGIPEAVTAGSGTLAVRVPGLRLARLMCAGSGPLISSSANRSGEPAPTSCAEAVRALGGSAALALDAGPAPSSIVSTIVDVTGSGARLVRAGAVAWKAIERVLESERC